MVFSRRRCPGWQGEARWSVGFVGRQPGGWRGDERARRADPAQRACLEVAPATGIGQSIARTAGFNVAAAGRRRPGRHHSGAHARADVRGDYAAISAWFGLVLMVGAIGQPAALCFYVARSRFAHASTWRRRGR